MRSAGGGLVADGHGQTFEAAVEEVDETLATGLRHAPVARRVGVALLPLNAIAGEPLDGVGGAVAEGADELLVGAATGDAHEVVEHLVGGVGARRPNSSGSWGKRIWASAKRVLPPRSGIAAPSR